MTQQFRIEPWLDYHGAATLFLVFDGDGCECGRFPSEREAISRAALLENTERILQEIGTGGDVADVLHRHKDFIDSLNPRERERLLEQIHDAASETQ
jgi:hypothetical protein